MVYFRLLFHSLVYHVGLELLIKPFIILFITHIYLIIILLFFYLFLFTFANPTSYYYSNETLSY